MKNRKPESEAGRSVPVPGRRNISCNHNLAYPAPLYANCLRKPSKALSPLQPVGTRQNIKPSHDSIKLHPDRIKPKNLSKMPIFQVEPTRTNRKKNITRPYLAPTIVSHAGRHAMAQPIGAVVPIIGSPAGHQTKNLQKIPSLSAVVLAKAENQTGSKCI